jgi:hypothetical protein
VLGRAMHLTTLIYILFYVNISTFCANWCLLHVSKLPLSLLLPNAPHTWTWDLLVKYWSLNHMFLTYRIWVFCGWQRQHDEEASSWWYLIVFEDHFNRFCCFSLSPLLSVYVKEHTRTHHPWSLCMDPHILDIHRLFICALWIWAFLSCVLL